MKNQSFTTLLCFLMVKGIHLNLNELLNSKVVNQVDNQFGE
ncbi:hypothetical protein [Leuconostoc miyukkimchii]|nr:hypothetical protein [Leuconostoc miyukkimchii]